MWRFYPNTVFAKADWALLRAYTFQNPYRIAKHYLVSTGADDPYTYGETPLHTMEKIVDAFDIRPIDLVYELGCGRGRTCLWLATHIGCQVVGLETVPQFMEVATKVQESHQIHNLSFQADDFFDADYSLPSVVYLYGTSMDDASIRKLTNRLGDLPPGAKVITVSFALTDYMKVPFLKVVKSIKVSFTWGETDVYLHEKLG